jgi:hypothetical protein
MAKSSSAVEIMEMLPAETRRRLHVVDLKVVRGAVLVKDRIQSHFELVAQSERRLARWKFENGFCGGRPYCMTFVGIGEDREHKLCKACRQEAGRPQRQNRKSAYGVIRKKEREQERASKGAGG